MNTDDQDRSLGDTATFAGSSKRRSADASLGDERTLGGGDAAGIDTVFDDIEVIDLAARYKTEGTLGRGGMGEVLLALDTRLDRKVAIKRILGEAARSKTAVSRFLTEAKAIAALNHPNVVQIYDYGRAADGPFLIMEYVDGSSLLDRCRDGALPLEQAVDLACQLCDGLAKAHDLGIVHRDIKPANVLLTKDGLPKLTDFGLAKAEAADHQMTMTGAVLGTPDFMPPEQRKDAALVDHRSDLWSLAATLYQMVTGRSPKIIRFDLLPTGLTTVLGKALEESKDDRFQSAREFRDALKTSLVASAPAAAELGEGQCPACGVRNDSSRRFCRGCGESLEASCLSCSKPMPMWEHICGQCGTKQAPLLEDRRGELAARQAEAESLLKDYDFDQAERLTASLRDESDPRLKQFVFWANNFFGKIGEARDAQLARTGERLTEALKHEASFDYPSAIHALEQVPEILRSRTLDGHSDSVRSGLDRIRNKQAEASRLERLVKARIAARELSDLLPYVRKLLTLRPDRADVAKLCSQLEERQQKLVAQRDEAITLARGHLDSKNYESALAALRKVDRSVETADVAQARSEAAASLARLQALLQEIGAAITAKQLDGLLGKVEDALRLKPDHNDLAKLRESLQAREAKIAAGIKELVTEADADLKAGRFDKALATLRRIPRERCGPNITSLLERYEDLVVTRADTIAGFHALPQVSDLSRVEGIDFKSLAGRGRQYLQHIVTYGLTDPAVEQWCERCEAIAEKRITAEAEARRAKQRWYRLIIGSGAAVAGLLLVAVGIWARSAWRAASVQSALAKSDWQAALALAPDNIQAIVGLVQAKLAATPPDIASAFLDIERAEKVIGLSAVMQQLRAEAHTIRAVEHARHTRLNEASLDMERARELGGKDALLQTARTALAAAWLDRAVEDAQADRLDDAGTALTQARRLSLNDSAVNKAKEAITTAQLARAEKAISANDPAAASEALEAAAASGAPLEATAKLRARAALLEAFNLASKGDMDKAVAKATEASLADARVASALLSEPAHAMLKKAILADYRGKFDSAIAASDWDMALRIAARAGRLDQTTSQWVVRAYNNSDPFNDVLSPSLWAKVPALLATWPPEDISALPPICNSIGLTLKVLPVGQYENSEPFAIGVYEVTNREWNLVMGSIPSKWKDDDRPVENVNWLDAMAFCEKLSALPDEKQAGLVYRLPTEAEWEHACRAGTTSSFSFGSDDASLGDYGWFDLNAGGESHGVGQKKPNAWGLYDMHGNVWEWLDAWMSPNRCCRGGAFSGPSEHCQSGFRNGALPEYRAHNLGFRVVVSLKAKKGS